MCVAVVICFVVSSLFGVRVTHGSYDGVACGSRVVVVNLDVQMSVFVCGSVI